MELRSALARCVSTFGLLGADVHTGTIPRTFVNTK